MPAKRKFGRPKQAILKELDPTEVSVVERHKWLFLRYGKTIKGKQWDSWQVEVGAGRWKSKEAALAMKGEFLALLSKETNLPLHKVCTPIAKKARTDMVTPARRASQLTDTLSPMELEMPKKQKVPPCNYEKERVKKRRVQRAEQRKAAFLAWKREAQERLARLKDAIQRNNARSLIAITEDNPEGIELNAIAIERVHRKATGVGMYYHLLLERKTNWEDYEEHDQIQHTQAKAAEVAWVCKDTIYR